MFTLSASPSNRQYPRCRRHLRKERVRPRDLLGEDEVLMLYVEHRRSRMYLCAVKMQLC